MRVVDPERLGDPHLAVGIFRHFGDVEFFGAARLVDRDHLEALRTVLIAPARDDVGHVMADVAADGPKVDEDGLPGERFRGRLTAVLPGGRAVE